MPYRPTERTRARLAAARERIVSAALTQLADGGYASASVVAVARRAGVATGSVYRHFPSKGDLFAEVFRRAAQREVDVLRTMTDRSEPVTHRLAAWVEAFGNVVAEALACGVPVVAYGRGGPAEIVRDGETGFVVDGEHEMAEAIGRLGEIDPRRCRESARERFDVATVAEAYERAYEQATHPLKSRS